MASIDPHNMPDLKTLSVCFLGAGNLGLPILQSLVRSSRAARPTSAISIIEFFVCVRSQSTKDKLSKIFKDQSHVDITIGENVTAVEASEVVILAVDPADVTSTLQEDGMDQAFSSGEKLLISVAAGWTTDDLKRTLFRDNYSMNDEPKTGQAHILRTLPNIAAQVGESMTAIEISEPAHPDWALTITDAIFSSIGTTAHVPPSLMDATTAVAGSTPAFFAVICDALIDASVAVGVPRPMAQKMIYQSMLGTATMMRDGLHPGLLKDQGTSPEGCTIGGLMVLEEGALRGTLGRGLREAVTVARRMGYEPHVNDTRR
ncbi:pyrroline-5-carboxylate reductase [Plectosphaerella cucumerina]|uniref:Pyrroline-5-carboxylate reductase n=1 Tax=Plectosphaerella cucumerina TaxID=40658 RepID=A0A8K0X573_9PEZI|nr:pyrroline-5-carboxylate reductase [Plectosphaerella cucumerina]